MDQSMQVLQQEAMRRRSGMAPASNVGVVPPAVQPVQQTQPSMGGGAEGFPSDQAGQAIADQKPGESEILAKALVKRYHELPTF